MKAFRTVCERLEKLELREVMIDLSMPTTISSKEKNSDGKAEENNESDVSHASSSRFPRLKELRLELSWPSSPRQLNLIIAQCPMLQTLVWETTRWGLYVRRRFCELYVSSTWPYLDSITIAGYGTYINEEDHIRILKAAKLPLRRLEFNTGCTLPETFDLYRSHFSTIQTMDLTFSLSSHSGARTVEILTSCPSLEIIKSHIITAQEIFNAGPWVCRNLQVFSVCIDMAFPNNAENRRFSPEEIEQCRIVYKQLAALKQLRELNSLVPYRNVIHVYLLPRQHPVQLPLRLKAGLDLMASSTKLESVHFWGGKRVVHMKELKWMVEHWKRLKHIQGQWRTGSPVVKDKYLRFGKLVDWLRERGIKTDGSHHECYTNGGPEDVEYEDCCSSSEDEDETEASFLANKE
ncbi:hypothetical protein BGX26_010838 [Mortierella sp. AD094]|nr:hypothetical protein BGX26_010838 [Mortierella sp. AD094]